MKILIIGAGEVGSNLAQRLGQEAKDVVVVDENDERLKQLSERADVQTLQGSGSSPSTLRRAGIEDADLLIAVTDSDEVNLVACLLTQAAYPATRKIARIRNPEYHEKTGILAEDYLGLDLAINPEREAAETIIKILGIPAGATDLVEFAGGRVRLVGLSIDPGSPFEGRPLSELPALNPERSILVAAIVRGEEEVIIPKGDARPRAGDIVYAVTPAEKVPELFRLAGKKTERVRRVIVVGGTNIGAHVARHFAHQDRHVKLIEADEDRAEELAEQLRGALVVRGDGTDRAFLLQHGVESCDALVAATSDEEDNILIALLAKRMGADRVIPVVNRTAYAPLVSALGVDIAVSPRDVAVSAILAHIRAGKILSARTLRNDVAEAIEFVAMPTSDVVGKPLSELSLPRGVIVGAIVRGEEVVIPTGADAIREGDRVIVFAARAAIPKLEKALAVKADFF